MDDKAIKSLFPFLVPVPALLLAAGRYVEACAYCSLVALIVWEKR